MVEPSTFKNIFEDIFESTLLAELESKSILMNTGSGETLMKVGRPVMGVPLMLSGTIKVSRVNDEGQELLLYYITAGKTCPMSLTCFMTSQLSSVNALTEEDCSFWVVPAKVVEELFNSRPAWKTFVMNTILDGLTQVIKSVDDLAFKKTDERLVSYLKEKSRINGSALINHSHQQIADELATNRVVISRLLKKLETDKKLLLYRNQIRIMKEL